MAFLEDLGRSGAMSGINNVLGKAIELRQTENQQAERAYTMGLQAEELGIHKAASEREATKFEWAAKKEKETQALRSMPVPVSQIFGPDYQSDPAKKMQVDKARELGLITEPAPGVLMTTAGNAEELKKHAAGDLEWTKKVAETNMVNTNNKLSEIDNALLEETNPKKVEELTAQRAKLSKKLTGLTEAMKRVDIKHQQLVELEKTKQTGKITKGPGGALYQKDELGNMVELVPPQEKEAKAPTTRNRDVGDKQITEEWRDGAWVKVGESPRWNERSGKREDRLAANQQFKNERDMRQDFEKLPEVKNYNETNIRASQMTQALEESKKTNNFVAVDQALITMFNKMTDPQSVVRESEYARTSNDIATVNSIKGKAQKVLMGGAGLTNEERNALKVMSDRFLAASEGRYGEVADEYRRLAKTYGYEPNNVVFRGASKKGAGTVKTADEFLKKYGGK